MTYSGAGMKLVDPDETVVLVIGTSPNAEERDRPLAERLKAEIDRRGAGHAYRRAVVVGDEGYLEHGAFYAILILSVIMYVQTMVHIPEVITGLGGATLIGISLWSSIRYNRQQNADAVDAARGAEI